MISVVYFALLPAASETDDFPAREKAAWQSIEPSPGPIWNYTVILQYALRRLRYKLKYSAVGFELLPQTFILSKLQHTDEIILGEQLDKRKFRRRMLAAGIIEPTSSRRRGEGRPALLYQYRPDAVAEVKAWRLFPKEQCAITFEE